jgi:hypothetical protein
MTTAQPAATGEPPQPQRGLTAEERGRDISAAQADAEAQTSRVQQYLHAMSPRFVWSMAEGYPVVVYVTVYPVLWLLLWPLRAYQKKNHPDDYAESQRKK